MSESWFFPDSYLQEMEALVAAMYSVEGKTKKPDIKDVLLMAQAFGIYMRGQTEKAGSIGNFLKGIRKTGGPVIARTELPNKRYYEFLRFVAQKAAEAEEEIEAETELPAQPEPAKPVKHLAEKRPDLASVWEQILDAYQANAPRTWPIMSKRPTLARMGARLEMGIKYAGGAEEFVALFSTALHKMPSFYRNEYVRKGENLRPMLDCLTCLLSSDKHHKDLGVAGWRMFVWSDLIEVSAAPDPGTRHPSEEFISWTGTRWSYRDPFMADEEIEQHKAALIAAGLAPVNSQ
jgi:hypothetical protein